MNNNIICCLLLITLILLSVIYSKIDSKQGYKLGNIQRCQYPPCSAGGIYSDSKCPPNQHCELSQFKNCTRCVPN